MTAAGTSGNDLLHQALDQAYSVLGWANGGDAGKQEEGKASSNTNDNDDSADADKKANGKKGDGEGDEDEDEGEKSWRNPIGPGNHPNDPAARVNQGTGATPSTASHAGHSNNPELAQAAPSNGDGKRTEPDVESAEREVMQERSTTESPDRRQGQGQGQGQTAVQREHDVGARLQKKQAPIDRALGADGLVDEKMQGTVDPLLDAQQNRRDGRPNDTKRGMVRDISEGVQGLMGGQGDRTASDDDDEEEQGDGEGGKKKARFNLLRKVKIKGGDDVEEEEPAPVTFEEHPADRGPLWASR